MVGIPVQCNGCPPDQRCCQLDLDDDFDDRTWGERFGDVFFFPICWTVLISLVLGVAGLMFAAGAWGFSTGFDLLAQM